MVEKGGSETFSHSRFDARRERPHRDPGRRSGAVRTRARISYASLNPVQKAHVSGALAASLGSSNAGATPAGKPAPRAAAPACSTMDPGEEGDEGDDACPPTNFAPAGGGGGAVQNYQPSGQDACGEKRGDNVKVNQNCQNVSDPDLAGRGQAQNETAVAIDPSNKNHVIASQNDYRRGDGNCYGAYSLDGGNHWSDTTIPMGFTRGTNFGGTARQYWQAGGDTSVAWDTKGNAYFSCQVFNRGAGRLPEQGPVERVLRLPFDRQQRRVVELSGAPGLRVQRHGRHGSGAPRQAVHDGRRPFREPVPRSCLRDVDAVRH
jgi:hypothetical protein